MTKEKMSLIDIQKCEYDILIEFDNYCKKHSIIYSLSGGTTLGAVRHNGFIPWDDDVDVAMDFKNYNLFLECLKKEPLSSKYSFESYYDNSSLYPYGKIIDKTTIVEGSHLTLDKHIWLDVFPIVNINGVKELEKLYKYKAIFVSRYQKKCNDRLLKKLIKKIFKIIFCFVPTNYILKKFKKQENKYKNINTNYCAVLWDCKRGLNHIFPTDMFKEIVMVKFVDRELPIVKDFDNYLKIMYGDYMKLPPIDKRENHNFDAWRIVDEL